VHADWSAKRSGRGGEVVQPRRRGIPSSRSAPPEYPPCATCTCVDALERDKRATAKCQRAQIIGCQGLQLVRCRRTSLELVGVKSPTLSGTTEPCRVSSPNPPILRALQDRLVERSLVFHSANCAVNHAKSSVPLAAFVTT
jgi:hypothetical protein